MKKFIGALIIIALIISLGYVKTVIDDRKAGQAFEEGELSSQVKLSDSEKRADSLKLALIEKDIEYSDSLLNKDKQFGSQMDSLADIVETQSAEKAALEKKLKSVATSTQKKPTKTISKSEKVYNYYKTSYSQLPKDLSEYEKKIAVSEIRDETAKKFSITLSELNKIRQKYNLSY